MSRNTESRRESRHGFAGREIKEFLAELLYPRRCPICDEILDRPWKFKSAAKRGTNRAGEKTAPEKRTDALPGISISSGSRCCPACERSLPRIRGSVCMKCGRPVGDERQEYCEDCRKQGHFYDRGAAAFTYTGALRHSVYRMKSANRRDYIPFFAESMAEVLARYLGNWRPEVILPVPMYPRKRRRRGYNQSELLAEEIGRLTGLPVEKNRLYCTRMTREQKNLGREERLSNLRGSFAVREDLPAVRRVLLIDDVYTTGSTVDEISRVLRKNGVQFIFFVVLCTGKGKKGGMHKGKSVI